MLKLTATARLYRDPEMNYTANGLCVTKFRARGEYWTKQTGNEPFWIEGVAFDKVAEYISKNAERGTSVTLCGDFSLRHWKNNKGENQVSYSLVVNSASDFGITAGWRKEKEEEYNPEGTPDEVDGTFDPEHPF